MKNKKRKVKKQIVQWHHISYDPEIKVPIYKGEHWQLTKLIRKLNLSKYKKFSKGFGLSLISVGTGFYERGVDIENYFKDLHY